MATFDWIPDQGASFELAPRVNRTQFGDGYSQRVPDGLNSVMETWNLAFTLRTKAEVGAIDAFLRTQKGATAFDWTSPAGTVGKFVCVRWSASYLHDLDSSLTATFEQVPA